MRFGLPGSLVVLAPACLTAMALGRYPWAAAQKARPGDPGPGAAHKPRDAWGPFARLTGLVVARATLFYGFNTFIPLYVLHVLGGSQAAGATALTVFALAGVAGNLLGGKLSDRLGYLRVTVGSFCLLVPLIPAMLWVSTVAGAVVVLAAIGAVLTSTYSPLVILGQRYLPNHIGLSAGVTLGIAVAIGGVATPVLGRIGDLYGLWTAVAVLAVMPVVSVGLALTLPPPAGR
jgi:FSR family fosmidomycin resistance protein-like MFS transporter